MLLEFLPLIIRSGVFFCFLWLLEGWSIWPFAVFFIALLLRNSQLHSTLFYYLSFDYSYRYRIRVSAFEYGIMYSSTPQNNPKFPSK